MRRTWRVALAATVVASVTGLGVLAATSSADTGARVIELTIRHSAFDKASVTVRRGETVTFVVHNTDPILHELIVGPADVQLRHELGTEPRHGPLPGEVSLPPGTTGSTTYRVTTSRPIQFACHVPGHFAYGMQGVVRVISRG